MTQDARFEDGHERPVNIGAVDLDDLAVLSALAQDAVFPVSEIRWLKSERKLACLVNRFRWELETQDKERAQAMLVVSDVIRMSSQGVDRSENDVILSLLSVTFEPGEDGTGHVILTLAGVGAIRAEVEALDVQLRDMTRPYRAPSGKAPHHDV